MERTNIRYGRQKPSRKAADLAKQVLSYDLSPAHQAPILHLRAAINKNPMSFPPFVYYVS